MVFLTCRNVIPHGALLQAMSHCCRGKTMLAFWACQTRRCFILSRRDGAAYLQSETQLAAETQHELNDFMVRTHLQQCPCTTEPDAGEYASCSVSSLISLPLHRSCMLLRKGQEGPRIPAAVLLMRPVKPTLHPVVVCCTGSLDGDSPR
jgi:hypothetical protein